MSRAMRPGELVEVAQRFGYFEPEATIVPIPIVFAKPFVGGRSMLTACIIAALGKRNAVAQSDALAATAYAVRDGDDPMGKLRAFSLAAHNLQYATAQHWSRP